MTYQRKEVIGDCELFLADCMEVLPTLGKVDAVVTDPPYGLGVLWAGGGGSKNSSWKFDPKEARSWDQNAPDVSNIIGAGEWAIVWGGNYFSLPLSRGWLVWDKGIPDFTTGHAELAWTNIEQPIRSMKLCPNVMTPTGSDGTKLHPTQKPIEIMRWCLGFLPDSQTILDPFMGSGTTGVACVQLQRKFIGIELDETYFDIACKRIEEAYKQPQLFPAEKPKPAKTRDMFENEGANS